MKLFPHLDPGTWLRGRGLLDGEFIVLDKARATEYKPMSTTPTSTSNLLFDLAALRRPTDALPFVRKYGLLFHGPDADEFREPWSEWEYVSLLLTELLDLYLNLRRAVRGDVVAAQELRNRWGERIRDFYKGEASSDEVFYFRASDFLARLTSQGLKNARYCVESAAKYTEDDKPLGDPSDFVLTVYPPNLLGYAYYQLAHLLSRGAPGAKCPECGRVFVVKDRRQRFCSPQCAQRARYRRWKERQS